jgi:hypothetical protein
MVARYITVFFAISAALIFASLTSAAPYYVPPPSHPEPLCARDPKKRIGGPGYFPMWQGKDGPLSWTNGRGVSNVWWLPNALDFKLQSQAANSKQWNYFMLQIKTPGKPDGVYGYVVQKGTWCYGHVPEDAYLQGSTAKWWVMSRDTERPA